MTVLIFILSFFIARVFYLLAKKNRKHLFLHPLLGILFFLLAFYLSSIVLSILLRVVLKNSFGVNEIVIYCFTIPFAFLISGIHYKIAESRFNKTRKKSNINTIGKQ